MKTPIALMVAALSACAPSASDVTSQPVPPGTTAPIPGVSERAMRVYREAIVIDAHNDIFTNVLDEDYDPDVRHPAGISWLTPGAGQSDLPRFIESGITGQWLSAFIDAPFARQTPDASYERTIVFLDTIDAWIARHPERLIRATTAADVRRAKQQGKIAMLVGVEGGHAIENSLDNLREIHRRGARYLTLTWNNGTDWAGSSGGIDGTRTGGLTDFGRDVVREMNRLGMLVDVSHVSEETFFDAIETSSDPVIASHSSARAITDHVRNLTDDQLRAIARNGGVVNVNFFPRFIDPAHWAAFRAIDPALEALRDSLQQAGADQTVIAAGISARRAQLTRAIPPTPLSVLIDHFDHIARVAGVNHVGIGSDFDGISSAPQDMEDVTHLPRIAQGLLDRGYSEDDVRRILGGNMLRVMEQVLDR